MKRGDLDVTVGQKAASIAHNFLNLINGKVAGCVESRAVHRKIDDMQADFAFDFGAVNLTGIGRLRCSRTFREYGQGVEGRIFAAGRMIDGESHTDKFKRSRANDFALAHFLHCR